MKSPEFCIFECTNPDCRFRFPASFHQKGKEICPKCHWRTHPDREIVDSLPINISDPGSSSASQIDGFLDNIRSSLNVGAIFRTADGVGIRRLHLAGMTATPDNPKVAKTALGSEFSTPYTYHRNGVMAITNIKKEGICVWALEGGKNAESIFTLKTYQIPGQLLLVVGNERTGVDPAILDLCDRVIAIPMIGAKGSLNVSVAFSIAAYTLRFFSRDEKNG